MFGCWDGGRVLLDPGLRVSVALVVVSGVSDGVRIGVRRRCCTWWRSVHGTRM